MSKWELSDNLIREYSEREDIPCDPMSPVIYVVVYLSQNTITQILQTVNKYKLSLHVMYLSRM